MHHFMHFSFLSSFFGSKSRAKHSNPHFAQIPFPILWCVQPFRLTERKKMSIHMPSAHRPAAERLTTDEWILLFFFGFCLRRCRYGDSVSFESERLFLGLFVRRLPSIWPRQIASSDVNSNGTIYDAENVCLLWTIEAHSSKN